MNNTPKLEHFTDAFGRKWLVHSKETCDSGTNCCIHNPSEHHMRDWPLTFRPDKRNLAERICEHGVGHPDPDSLMFIAKHDKVNPEHVYRVPSIHGCDGCCHKEH